MTKLIGSNAQKDPRSAAKSGRSERGCLLFSIKVCICVCVTALHNQTEDNQCDTPVRHKGVTEQNSTQPLPVCVASESFISSSWEPIMKSPFCDSLLEHQDIQPADGLKPISKPKNSRMTRSIPLSCGSQMSHLLFKLVLPSV